MIRSRSRGVVVVVVLGSGVLLAWAGARMWSNLNESPPTEVTVRVPAEFIEKMASWPVGLICFTSAEDPITELKGISHDAVGVSGAELTLVVQEMMALAGNRDTPIGLRIISEGSEANQFDKNEKIRILVARPKGEQEIREITGGGGIQITFEQFESESPDEPLADPGAPVTSTGSPSESRICSGVTIGFHRAPGG